ncbi:MAG: asparagine synthase C-terminal domain-containing protein [Caulobacter sp.]
MGDYLVITWPPGQAGAAGEAMAHALVADGQWRLAYSAFCVRVFVKGARAPAVQVLARRGGVVLGEVYDTETTLAGVPRPFDLSVLAGARPEDAAQVLTRCAWGRYVAVLTTLRGSTAEPPMVYRDPLGGLECVTWTRDDVTLVSSQIPTAGRHAPAGLGLDWDRIEALVGDIALSSDELCLTGVQAVGPGVLRHGPGGRQALRLWRPRDHVGKAVRALPKDLAACVEGCVRALVQTRSRVVAEVSGGLDSAIVAGVLRAADAPVAAVTHHYWATPEGDERVYARAVADGLGVELTAVARGELRYSPETLMRCAGGPRPPFNAQDPDYDDDMAQRLVAVGAQALLTGHGGDAVFYQMPTEALAREILADLVRGGWASRSGRARAVVGLEGAARRMRMSVWKLGLMALGRRAADPPGLAGPSFLARPQDLSRRHPWQRDLRGVSGAKRIQIQALVNTQALFGDSLRGRVADLIHPLLCQPVVELCLGVPANVLAVGDHDRPFARAAFADRLPAIVRDRQGKGDITQVFSRSLAGSLDVLAPFLLEGALVRQGVLDAARLAPLLDPQVIQWRDVTGELMRVIFIEAWVRAWEARLAGAAPAPDGTARAPQGDGAPAAS